jgi:hypothetical protein
MAEVRDTDLALALARTDSILIADRAKSAAGSG